MKAKGGHLWRHSDFLKLWGGQTISEVGTQVTMLALPTTAIALLHAGPLQVGVLSALQYLAFPVLGLVAGVWVDRLRRRPVLMACDLLRLLALASIPGAWLTGVLTMWEVYVVAAVAGIGTVFFEVAYQSYLPSLIERRDLVEGNAKLEFSRSSAGVVGPALAGFLIQLVRPAAAIFADALSYLMSVLTLWWIRRPEPAPAPPPAGRGGGFLQELWEGVRLVAAHRMIRLIAATTATSNLGNSISFAVYLLFAYHRLHLSPSTVGGILSIGSIGAVGGAAIAAPMGRRLGLGPTLTLTIALDGVLTFCVPLASLGVPVALLVIASFSQAMGTIYNVNWVSYRQTAVPVRLQGRLNATVRTVIWGALPVGSVIGGVLGAHIGVVPTLYVGASIQVLAVTWLLIGPIRLREMPPPVD